MFCHIQYSRRFCKDVSVGYYNKIEPNTKNKPPCSALMAGLRLLAQSSSSSVSRPLSVIVILRKGHGLGCYCKNSPQAQCPHHDHKKIEPIAALPKQRYLKNTAFKK